MAIIISLIVVVSAAAFVQRKHVGLVLILLSIIQLLVGGGFAPPTTTIVAGVVGTRINAPFTWWRAHLSVHSRRFLAKMWPWSFITYFSVELGQFILGSFFGVGNLVQPEPHAHSYDPHSWTYAVDGPCWICARYPETDRFTSGTFDERVTGATTRWSAGMERSES